MINRFEIEVKYQNSEMKGKYLKVNAFHLKKDSAISFRCYRQNTNKKIKNLKKDTILYIKGTFEVNESNVTVLNIKEIFEVEEAKFTNLSEISEYNINLEDNI